MIILDEMASHLVRIRFLVKLFSKMIKRRQNIIENHKTLIEVQKKNKKKKKR